VIEFGLHEEILGNDDDDSDDCLTSSSSTCTLYTNDLTLRLNKILVYLIVILLLCSGSDYVKIEGKSVRIEGDIYLSGNAHLEFENCDYEVRENTSKMKLSS